MCKKRECQKKRNFHRWLKVHLVYVCSFVNDRKQFHNNADFHHFSFLFLVKDSFNVFLLSPSCICFFEYVFKINCVFSITNYGYCCCFRFSCFGRSKKISKSHGIHLFSRIDLGQASDRKPKIAI